jgi:hypothetical protein
MQYFAQYTFLKTKSQRGGSKKAWELVQIKKASVMKCQYSPAAFLPFQLLYRMASHFGNPM